MMGLAHLGQWVNEWAASQLSYRRWLAMTPGQQQDSGITYHGNHYKTLREFIQRKLHPLPLGKRERLLAIMAEQNTHPDTWRTKDGELLSIAEINDHQLVALVKWLEWAWSRHRVPQPKIHQALIEAGYARGVLKNGWARGL